MLRGCRYCLAIPFYNLNQHACCVYLVYKCVYVSASACVRVCVYACACVCVVNYKISLKRIKTNVIKLAYFNHHLSYTLSTALHRRLYVTVGKYTWYENT